MSKIIIHNQLENDENDEMAMRLVSKVMAKGKINTTAGVNHYRHVSIFDTWQGEVVVYCRANKTGTSTFYVYVEP